MAGIPNRKKAISLVAISTPGDVKTYPTGTYCVPADGDGTFLLSDSTAAAQFSWSSGSNGGISYDKNTGATTITTLTASQAFVSGGLSVGNYVQLLPVGNVAIPTNQTASYIYTSGSTNDLYFTQYQPGSGYNNTTRLRWLESELSTGLLHGGILSTVTGTTTFNVSAGSGLIVSYNASTTSDPYPTVQFVNWGNFVSQSLIYSASAPITYVAIDNFGAISQTNTAFTPAQFKDRIVLGRVLHQTGSVTNGSITTPTTAYAINSNTYDFIRAFGPLKVNGQILAASGSTLGLTRTAGDSYVEGRNYSTDPNSPNYILAANDPALTTTKIYYQWVSGSTVNIDTNGGVGYSAVRPAFYNLNGTVTTITPTNNKYTVQRVYWFPKSVTRALYIYYGTAIYGTLTEAVAAINNEPSFVEGDNTRASAVYLGAVVLEANTTDLTVTTKAQIVNAGIFRGTGGGGGGGGTTSPGGVNHSIQYNDAGSFNGSANLTYDTVTLTLNGNFNLVGTGSIDFDGGTLTGSLAKFTTMSGSVITGSTALYTTITGSTVTGSTALFTTITASSGITVNGNSVVLTNDSRLSDSRNPTGSAGGDLTGSYPNPTLKDLTTATTYISTTAIPSITLDAKGRITNLSSASIQIAESQVTNLTTDLTTLTTNVAAAQSTADAKVAKAGDTMTGALTMSSGASLVLTGGASSGQGNIQFGAAASSLYDSNVLYVDNNSRTTGWVCSSTPGFAASNGPFFAMRGNTYSAIASQRGNLYLFAGNPSSPSASEGGVSLGTGNSIIRFFINKDGKTVFNNSNTVGSALISIAGSYTSTSVADSIIYNTTNISPSVGGDAYGITNSPTFTKASSGTHAYFLGCNFQPPTIAAGAATVTNAATVYVGGGTTGATNNYAVWVAGGNTRLDGNLSLGLAPSATTAVVHIKAGTATAGTAPLKLTSGTNLTTPEAGVFEYDGSNLYFTTGSVRESISAKVSRAGDTMTGRLSVSGGITVTDATAPTLLQLAGKGGASTGYADIYMQDQSGYPTGQLWGISMGVDKSLLFFSYGGSFVNAFRLQQNGGVRIGNGFVSSTTVASNVFASALNFGAGLSAPTARLHISGGSATAGTAPLKFNAGINLTSPESGSMEYDGNELYFTTGSVRKTINYRRFVTSSIASHTASVGSCVIASGSFIITLPSPSTSGNGAEIVVKKTSDSASTITISASAGSIDGATTQSLTTQYSSYTFVSDGSTNWWII